MEQLEKLEAKIREIVGKYQVLMTENASLKGRVRELEAITQQLEESLLRESESVSRLNDDREVTKMAIDELVQSLESLESAG